MQRRLARAVEGLEAHNEQKDADIPVGKSGHVVIAGYGRVDQMLGAVFDDQELPHVGLEGGCGHDCPIPGEMVLTGIGVPEQAARQIIDTRRQVEMDDVETRVQQEKT